MTGRVSWLLNERLHLKESAGSSVWNWMGLAMSSSLNDEFSYASSKKSIRQSHLSSGTTQIKMKSGCLWMPPQFSPICDFLRKKIHHPNLRRNVEKNQRRSYFANVQCHCKRIRCKLLPSGICTVAKENVTRFNIPQDVSEGHAIPPARMPTVWTIRDTRRCSHV